MKTLYLETRSKKQIPLSALKKIKEKRLGLIATVQHLSQIPRIKAELKKLGKQAFTSKGNVAVHECQVLGCDINAALNVANKVDAFLYVGGGDFHTLPLGYKTQKPIYNLSTTGELTTLPRERVNKFVRQKKAAYLHFLHEDKCGIIVTTKPGQQNLPLALILKEKLESKGKKPFLFLCDTLQLQELENYDCKVWINTACPGLQLEPGILNPRDIADFLSK